MGLEFVNQDKTCYISITKLSGRESDYKISAQDFIKNIRIEGWIIRRLKFSWRGIKVRNTVTEQNVNVSKTLTLTWREARLLKNILRSAFIVNVVFLKENDIVRVEVNKSEGD